MGEEEEEERERVRKAVCVHACGVEFIKQYACEYVLQLSYSIH